MPPDTSSAQAAARPRLTATRMRLPVIAPPGTGLGDLLLPNLCAPLRSAASSAVHPMRPLRPLRFIPCVLYVLCGSSHACSASSAVRPTGTQAGNWLALILSSALLCVLCVPLRSSAFLCVLCGSSHASSAVRPTGTQAGNWLALILSSALLCVLCVLCSSSHVSSASSAVRPIGTKVQ